MGVGVGVGVRVGVRVGVDGTKPLLGNLTVTFVTAHLLQPDLIRNFCFGFGVMLLHCHIVMCTVM